VLDHYFFKLIF